MIVDSHCHLNYPDFKEDFDDVLKRAKEAGVEHILTISTRLKEAPEIIELSNRHDFISHTIGVHPCDVKEDGVPLVNTLLKYSEHPKMCGYGETGLDYYHEGNPAELQKESFRNHISASLESEIPLIIHSRDAEEDILQILKEMNISRAKKPGVIHCFTGSEYFAKETLNMGFYISFSGIISFKNAKNLREIASFVPKDRMLVETDAPFLAPVPMRGKRNEPAFVKHTAIALSETLEMNIEELMAQTTQNFYTLFSKAHR